MRFVVSLNLLGVGFLMCLVSVVLCRSVSSLISNAALVPILVIHRFDHRANLYLCLSHYFGWRWGFVSFLLVCDFAKFWSLTCLTVCLRTYATSWTPIFVMDLLSGYIFWMFRVVVSPETNLHMSSADSIYHQTNLQPQLCFCNSWSVVHVHVYHCCAWSYTRW